MTRLAILGIDGATFDVIRPMIEKAAADYAKENNITPRSCK